MEIPTTQLIVLETPGVLPVKITGKNQGLPEPQTSFPEIWYPGLGKAGKEGLCVLLGVLRGFMILTKTLSHYSKSV